MKNYKNIKRTHNKLPKFNDGMSPSLNLVNPAILPGGSGMKIVESIQGTNGTYFGQNLLPGNPKGQLGYTPKIQAKPNNTAENVGNIAGTAIQFAGSAINSFGNNKSSQEILNESGQQSKQVMGVGYDYQNGPDESKQWSDLKRQNFGNTLATAGSGAAMGAAVGSIVPGLGTVAGGLIGGAVGIITGLFGSKSRANKLRKQMLNARRTAEARNTYAYSGAMSTGMQNEYYQENGDTDNGILYANKGKDLPMYNTGKDSSPWVKVGKNTKVWAPDDYAGKFANAMVGLGESLVDFNKRKATLVTEGEGVGKDDQYALTNDDTFVAGNDRSWLDGFTFSEKAQPNTLAVMSLDEGLKATQKVLEKSSLAPSTMKYMDKRKDVYMNNLQAVADEQRNQHEHQERYNTFMANRGRDLKKCDKGLEPWYQWTAHLPAALGGIQQIIDSGQNTYTPSTYRSNPYSQLALNTLAKNRPNPYNQIRETYDSERKALYGLRGMGANLRAQAGVAAILGAGANRANIYASNEDKMNQYRSSLASMASTLGQQDRVAKMDAAARQYQAMKDNAAAKYRMKNTGWQNISNAYEQTFADRFKLNLAERQLAQYNQYLNSDQLALLKDYINKQNA